jgi:hypothetical protein
MRLTCSQIRCPMYRRVTRLAASRDVFVAVVAEAWRWRQDLFAERLRCSASSSTVYGSLTSLIHLQNRRVCQYRRVLLQLSCRLYSHCILTLMCFSRPLIGILLYIYF